MNQSAIVAAGCGVSLGLGLALGPWLCAARLEGRLSTERAPAAASCEAATVAAPSTVTRLHPEDLDALRRELRALQVPASAPGRAMEPRLAADSEPAESQQVAREELETLLDTALARGTWNELDRDRFRSQLAQANEADQETMLAALATAINHQKLRVSLRGAPW